MKCSSVSRPRATDHCGLESRLFDLNTGFVLCPRQLPVLGQSPVCGAVRTGSSGRSRLRATLRTGSSFPCPHNSKPHLECKSPLFSVVVFDSALLAVAETSSHTSATAPRAQEQRPPPGRCRRSPATRRAASPPGGHCASPAWRRPLDPAWQRLSPRAGPDRAPNTAPPAVALPVAWQRRRIKGGR